MHKDQGMRVVNFINRCVKLVLRIGKFYRCWVGRVILKQFGNWIRILGADLNTYLPIRNEATREEYDANYYKGNQAIIKQQQADYYKNNKDAILKKQAVYRKLNKEGIKLYQTNYYIENKKTKKFCCDVCEIFFGSSSNLKKHLDSLKHSYAWLNALD